MFNILLALFAGILIGWNFHTFFLALNAPKILKNDINISQVFITDKNSTKQHPKPIEPIKIVKKIDKEKRDKPMQTSFYSLLHNNLFSDAMALYHNASPERVNLYKSTLNNYFKKRSETHTEETIQQIEEYIELEPNHEEAKLLLIEIYKKKKAYKEAIQLITELIDASSQIESEKFHDNLIKTSQLYIDSLIASKDFQQLQAFLETQIEYGVKSPFFIFSLANYYLSIDSVTPATKLLKEIEFDDEYGERAKKLLSKIENNENITETYQHKLPLKKEGSHFTIEVTIDNTPLTLLLDTGATLTMIDEEKISSLTLIEDEITLKTAGGEVSAQLQEAQKLTIGDIEIKNFKVTTSTFKEESADGLLGMNFFEKFKFMINQNEGVLYLSEK
jgi:clan AA aspartic protease (TIGR02281 family)